MRSTSWAVRQVQRTMLAGGATLVPRVPVPHVENQVARSLPFWRHYIPHLAGVLPSAAWDISIATFHRAITRSSPACSVSRLTRSPQLHIFVRFELEKSLLTGDLKVSDVPEAWNARYEEYLGITPPNNADGCLQDVHWSHGILGYFPTYTLGNLMSAQMYARALQEIPGLEAGYAQGEFAPLLNWLRERIHRHGRKLTAPELMQREFGTQISAQPLLTYLREKYAALYDL